jgi:hypothetical protein
VDVANADATRGFVRKVCESVRTDRNGIRGRKRGSRTEGRIKTHLVRKLAHIRLSVHRRLFRGGVAVSNEDGKSERNKHYNAMEERQNLGFVPVYSPDAICESLANCTLGTAQRGKKESIRPGLRLYAALLQ